MSEEFDFDVAIVGAGPAGISAALTLAKAGIETVVLERGQYSGAKNVSGAALYGPILNELVPNYWEDENSFERYLTTKKITLLSESKSVTIDADLRNFNQVPYNGVTVIRPKFDRWLADKAEEAGAMILPDTMVEDLVWNDKQIVGVKSGEEVLKAKLVIIAEGANNILVEKAKLAKKPKPRHFALGMKETYKLPKKKIEERFHLDDNEGMSNEILGYSKGIPGGGFYYTNKDTVSFGLILNMDVLTKKKLKAPEVFEEFKEHSYIKKLLKDAEMIEYSAHIIPEGGFKHMPKLYGNGVLVVGDAASMVLNAGLYIEGINFALESGKVAGETAIEILQTNNYTKKQTKLYKKKLKESFAYKDLKTFKRASHFLENKMMFTYVPDLLTGLFEKLLRNNGYPRKRIVTSAIGYVFKKGKLFGLIKLLIGAVRSL
ncbi:MAG: FAD-dependent oxidoreductase [Candidatus Heimdallarchaeota archaeon]|nr:MAG: FAD-dependent oxidoreductase [Candidatus Heimdallarchaeota archaeon]